ncbi:MAG TPA: nucleotide exchange factor GrpE [Candidatus Methylacidiphilales bacterium]
MIPGTHASVITLSDLQSGLAAAQETLARLSKGFEAYKQQVGEHNPESHAAEKESLLREILPIIDHLETALGSASSFLDEKLRQDLKIALHRLYKVLRDHGVEPTDDLGQPFDPLRHELVAELSDPAQPDKTVLQVKECGYLRDGEVFRPAKVVLNVLPEPPAGDGS